MLTFQILDKTVYDKKVFGMNISRALKSLWKVARIYQKTYFKMNILNSLWFTRFKAQNRKVLMRSAQEPPNQIMLKAFTPLFYGNFITFWWQL